MSVADESGANGGLVSVTLETYKQALKAYLLQRFRIHDKYIQNKRRGDKDYLGSESWTPKEQRWEKTERKKLEAMVQVLQLATEEIGKIKGDVLQEIESEKQHP